MRATTKLLDLLNTIEGSGSFETSGVKNFVPLGLQVKNIGEIAFPLNPIMAKALINVAHKAPFGKGSQTILDSNVRSAWEINADQLTFKNTAWNPFIEEILAEVKAGLGIEKSKISANLYKLLIYEEGDFFLAHKDSEKEKGIFGNF